MRNKLILSICLILCIFGTVLLATAQTPPPQFVNCATLAPSFVPSLYVNCQTTTPPPPTTLNPIFQTATRIAIVSPTPYPTSTLQTPTQEILNLYVVRVDAVNLRPSPSVNTTPIGTVTRNQEVNIQATQVSGVITWGKISEGVWVALKNGNTVYLELQP